NDFRGAAQLRALNHVHAISAAAHDEYAFTRLDPCPIASGADARRHATGNEAGEIERDVAVDHDNRGLINDRAFGKAADHAEGTDGNTLPVMAAVSAVELWSLGDARTFGAEMMQTLPTPPANSTGRNKSEYDVVAALNFADRGTNVFDHAGSLVAEHHGPHRYAPLAAHHVIVSAAQAYGGDAHQDLGGSRRIERDGLDRHRCADVAKYGSKAIHKPTVHLHPLTRPGTSMDLRWFRPGNPAQQRPQLIGSHGRIVGRLVVGEQVHIRPPHAVLRRRFLGKPPAVLGSDHPRIDPGGQARTLPDAA